MSYYVRIKRLNGRGDHANLGEWLNSSGVIEVGYYAGGWQDSMVHNSAPHLKFEREDDAVAYILAHGGVYSRKIPEVSPEENSIN